MLARLPLTKQIPLLTCEVPTFLFLPRFQGTGTSSSVQEAFHLSFSDQLAEPPPERS